MPRSEEEDVLVDQLATVAASRVGREIAIGVAKNTKKSINEVRGRTYNKTERQRLQTWQVLYQKLFVQSLDRQYTIDEQNRPIMRRKDDNWIENKQIKLKNKAGDFHFFAETIADHIAIYITHRKRSRRKIYRAGDFTEQWQAELFDWSVGDFSAWEASGDTSQRIKVRVAYCNAMLDKPGFITESRGKNKNQNLTKRGLLICIREELRRAQQHCDLEVARHSAHHKLGQLRRVYQTILKHAAQFSYQFRDTSIGNTLPINHPHMLFENNNPVHRMLGEFLAYCGPRSFGADVVRLNKAPVFEMARFHLHFNNRKSDKLPAGIFVSTGGMDAEPVKEDDILDFFKQFFTCFAEISRMGQAIELAWELTGQKGDFWAYNDERGCLSLQLLLDFAKHQLQKAQGILTRAQEMSDFRASLTQQNKGSDTESYIHAKNCVEEMKLCLNGLNSALNAVRDLQEARQQYTPSSEEQFNEKVHILLRHVVDFGEQDPHVCDDELAVLRQLADSQEVSARHKKSKQLDKTEDIDDVLSQQHHTKKDEGVSVLNQSQFNGTYSAIATNNTLRLTTRDMISFAKDDIPIEEVFVASIQEAIKKDDFNDLDYFYGRALLQAIENSDIEKLKQYVGEAGEFNCFDFIHAALVYVAKENPIFTLVDKGQAANTLYMAYAKYVVATRRKDIIIDYLGLLTCISQCGSIEDGVEQYVQEKYSRKTWVKRGLLLQYIERIKEQESNYCAQDFPMLALRAAWEGTLSTDSILDDLSFKYAAETDEVTEIIEQTLAQESNFLDVSYEQNDWDSLLQSLVASINEHARVMEKKEAIQAERLVRWRRQVAEMQVQLAIKNENSPYYCDHILQHFTTDRCTLSHYAMQNVVEQIGFSDVQDSRAWVVVDWLNKKKPMQLFDDSASGPSALVMGMVECSNVTVNQAVFNMVMERISVILTSKELEDIDYSEIIKARRLLTEVKAEFSTYGQALFTRRSFRDTVRELIGYTEKNIHSCSQLDSHHRNEFAHLLDVFQLSVAVDLPTLLSAKSMQLKKQNSHRFWHRYKPFSYVLRNWCAEVMQVIDAVALHRQNEAYIKARTGDLDAMQETVASHDRQLMLQEKKHTHMVKDVKKRADAAAQMIRMLEEENLQMRAQLDGFKSRDVQTQQRLKQQSQRLQDQEVAFQKMQQQVQDLLMRQDKFEQAYDDADYDHDQDTDCREIEFSSLPRQEKRMPKNDNQCTTILYRRIQRF